MVHFRASPHTRHVGIEGTFLTKHFELVESHKTLNFLTFIAIPWRGITFSSHPPFCLSSRELLLEFTWRFYSLSSHVSKTPWNLWPKLMTFLMLAYCLSAASDEAIYLKHEKQTTTVLSYNFYRYSLLNDEHRKIYVLWWIFYHFCFILCLANLQ